MKYLVLYIVIVGSHSAFGQKKMTYENRSYEPQIKTVQLYKPGTAIHRGLLQPAVISLHQQPGLSLEFDDLSDDISDYYVQIVHCDYTWKPSVLNDLEFIAAYNEFRINDYAFSSGTRIPYVHYRFEVPRVKLAGNYILVVYRNGDESDIVLSHRFMVHNSITELLQDGPNGALTLRSINQQLQFSISYRRLEVLNPSESMHLVVRQNQRWDNAGFDIKPSTIREAEKQLEYKLFDEDKYFVAGNEFRFVDFRSLNSPGQNTGYLDKSKNPVHLWVQPDKSKTHQAYAQYPDINGGYYIANLDYADATISSEYLNVTFRLASPVIPSSRIYVVGAFNQWAKDKAMQYNASSTSYSYTALLKQGWYNYQYIVQSNVHPSYHLEGSHFETENVYEVLLYHRPFGLQADVLVGYFIVPVNAR